MRIDATYLNPRGGRRPSAGAGGGPELKAVMAERYYFRLRSDGETIEDETGVLAASVAHAEAEALVLIEEFRKAGELPDAAAGWRMEIHDANGTVLRTLPLS
jgi:hypothetical protein